MKTNTLYIVLALLIFGILGTIVFVDNLQKNSEKKNPLGTASKIVEIAPHYVEYSDIALVKASNDGRAVLFFWAPWCSTCSALDDELKEKSNELPEDLTILKVNFDTQKDLKRKYQIVQQHTLVQIDKNGNEITKWVGGNVDLIKQQLKAI